MVWIGVVGVLAGVILEFLLNLVRETPHKRQEHMEFVKGLYADVNRCLKIEYTTDPIELLNRLTFPSVERAVREGKLHWLPSDVDKYVLQLFYLIDNLHRYTEVEIDIVAEEAKAKAETSSLREPPEFNKAREYIQETALGMLERSLSAYAMLLKRGLETSYPQLRDKVST
jgi:hypothetical protein